MFFIKKKDIRRVILEELFDKNLYTLSLSSIINKGFSFEDVIKNLLSITNDKNGVYSHCEEYFNQYPDIIKKYFPDKGYYYFKENESDLFIGIDYNGNRVFTNENIESLNLYRIKYDNKGLSHLKNIRELSLCILNNDIIDIINHFSKLNKLFIYVDELNQAKVKYHISNPSIVECHLGHVSNVIFTLPSSIKHLKMYDKVNKYIKGGLTEYPNLEIFETYTYQKSEVKVLLNHPNLKKIHLNGAKEEHIIIDNLTLKELIIEEGKVSELTIKNCVLESLTLLSNSPLKINITKDIPSLKKLKIAGKKIEDAHFLSYLSNIEELSIEGFDSLDLNDIKHMNKINNLQFSKIKQIINLEIINSFLALCDLKLYDIKRYTINHPLNLCLNELDVGFCKSDLLYEVIQYCEVERMTVQFVKNFDLNAFTRMEKLKEMWLIHVELHHAYLLLKASNLERLFLNINNEIDLSFVNQLKNLYTINIPKYQNQKDKIINLLLKHEKLEKIGFIDYHGNDMSYDVIEDYKSIEITKYIDKKGESFGVFLDLSDDLNQHNNHDVEKLLKRLLKEKNVKHQIEFDSEADHFSAHSKNLEDIKLLIDVIKDNEK